MPKREDERYQRLSGSHPPYCTCVECQSKVPGRKAPGLLGRFSRRQVGEKRGKSHPADCGCATCGLLRSAGYLSESPRRRGRFIRKLFGKT
jgi:hypothetical protein